MQPLVVLIEFLPRQIDVELKVVFLLQLDSFRTGLRHLSLVVDGIQILHTLEAFE
jgi:hypothetical protein